MSDEQKKTAKAIKVLVIHRTQGVIMTSFARKKTELGLDYDREGFGYDFQAYHRDGVLNGFYWYKPNGDKCEVKANGILTYALCEFSDGIIDPENLTM